MTPERSRVKVSVIMGAYNCQDTVESAVRSILDQTYSNWELVVCDDASTDETYDVLERLARSAPNRIKVVRNDSNRRLSGALNRCLEVATGDFIARMDADDISHAQRLEKQVAYLAAHPLVDMVGTAMTRFGGIGTGSLVAPPARPNRYSLRTSSPFCHATVLARRTVFTKLRGYDESEHVRRVEDIDLWFRFFAEGFVGRNLDEPLYLVREDVDAVARRTLGNRWNLMLVMYRGYRMLGYPASWYGIPAVLFLKAFAPRGVQTWYRNRQSSPRSRQAGTAR
jgi:glycosyltransferase EpsE